MEMRNDRNGEYRPDNHRYNETVKNEHRYDKHRNNEIVKMSTDTMNIETADTETMNTEMKTDTLVRRVLELAVTQPDKAALIFRSEVVTYREYGRQITRAAALLKSLGVKRGDRVLYTAVSKPQTFVLFLGIQYLEAVAVPTDKAGLPEGEISLYESAGASLLLTTLKMRDVPEGMKVITQKEFFASPGGRDGAAADGKADASSDGADGIPALKSPGQRGYPPDALRL